MGEELNKPIKQYNPKDNQNIYLKYGLNSVQGWKSSMENYTLDFAESDPQKVLNIFGIFEGHGGKEIPKYLSCHFFEHLKNNKNFKNCKYKEALSDTFLELDKSFKTDDVQKELNKYSEEFKSLKEQEIKNIYTIGEKVSEDELNQMITFNEVLDPRNIENSNVADFSGSSGIILLIGDNKNLFIANAGNSRCLVINKEGVIIKETKDHIMEDSEEKKRVDLARSLNEEEEEKREKGLQAEYLEITRGFGFWEFKGNEWMDQRDQEISADPDIIEVPLKEIQYIIVGSHGMFERDLNDNNNDSVNNKICKFFIEEMKRDENKSLSKIIEEYFEKNISKDKNDEKGLDNMSCFIISLKDKIQDFVKQKEIIEEEQRKKEEEEIKRKKEEEERKKQEEQRKRDEERKKREEERRKAEEEKKKLEEDQQNKKEEEDNKKNEENGENNNKYEDSNNKAV
mgnify:FL=1